MLILNKNILTIGGNRLEGGPLTPPEPPTPPTPTFDEVTIGSQTWTKYNISIDDGGEGIYHVDNVTANGVNFGTQYYYTPEAAIRVVSSIQGWHLPTQSECSTMITWLLGTPAYKLKSTSGWDNNGNGIDNYGFNGLPCGSYDRYNGLGYTGMLTSWLVNTVDNSNYYSMALLYNNSNVTLDVDSYSSYVAYSLRLIKDT